MVVVSTAFDAVERIRRVLGDEFVLARCATVAQARRAIAEGRVAGALLEPRDSRSVPPPRRWCARYGSPEQALAQVLAQALAHAIRFPCSRSCDDRRRGARRRSHYSSPTPTKSFSSKSWTLGAPFARCRRGCGELSSSAPCGVSSRRTSLRDSGRWSDSRSRAHPSRSRRRVSPTRWACIARRFGVTVAGMAWATCRRS